MELLHWRGDDPASCVHLELVLLMINIVEERDNSLVGTRVEEKFGLRTVESRVVVELVVLIQVECDSLAELGCFEECEL